MLPMNILIDECLPKKLKLAFSDHTVSTVPEMGWAGTKNGDLLALMVDEFDVFITIDGNMGYQQNLSSVMIAFILISAPSNRLADLLPLVPTIKQTLEHIQVGDIIIIES